MDFVFCTLTLNRFKECNALLRSVLSGTLQPKAVIILDNSGGNFVPDADVDTDSLYIYVPHMNLGVARGFNFLLHQTLTDFPDAYCIISNDDLVLYPDTLEALAKGIEANPDKLIYCSDLHSANSFSFFCVKPAHVLETVGWFEIAYHSYLEDCDFMYRARMLGHDLTPVDNCRIKDHVGSGTLKAFTVEEENAFHNRRAIGIEAYRKKWGSLPEDGGEKYTTPYNSGIDTVTWHREKFKRIHPFEI